MQIIYRAANLIDAHLVKAALAGEGILAFVGGEYLTGAVGELPANNLVVVMVSAADIERAAPIAAAIDAELSERRSGHADFEAGWDPA